MKSIKLKDLDGVSDVRRGYSIMRKELLKSGDLLYLTPRHIKKPEKRQMSFLFGIFLGLGLIQKLKAE